MKYATTSKNLKFMTNESKRPFISIILPVYGVENYIADAINDIRSQSFDDWELIVVDDCTLDKSIDIAKSLIEDDPRVRFVAHQHNQGLSAARNTGMQYARGDYLWIPDPDDRFDVHLLYDAVQSLQNHPADLLLFGHTQEYFDADGNFLYQNKLSLDAKVFDRAEDLQRIVLELEKETHLGYVWNKLYRRDLIEDKQLTFLDEVPLIEDILFNVAYIENIATMNALATTPYHYAKRVKANLTNAFVPQYYEMHRKRIAALEGLFEKWSIFDHTARTTLGALYGRYILSSLERNCDSRASLSHEDRKNWCKNVFCDPLYNELIPYARAGTSIPLKLCLFALRKKSTALCLILGRVIHAVQTHALPLFTKLKSGR